MSTKVKGDAIKEGSIPLSALKEMPCTYPIVDEINNVKHSVIGVSGGRTYYYVGEIDKNNESGSFKDSMIFNTEIVDYVNSIEYSRALNYIFLAIGNEEIGYTLNKIIISSENLVYTPIDFIQAVAPVSLSIAIDLNNFEIYYKEHVNLTNSNIKIYCLYRSKCLDSDLLTDGVLKTTPQSLLDFHKNQALDNLGIREKLDKLVDIAYKNLKSLRDNSQLIPGQQYRIIDYVTTTTQKNTVSALHQFDIIVTADAVDELNENARAIQHQFEDPESNEAIYFLNSDLNA